MITQEMLSDDNEETLDFTQLNSTISQASENEITLKKDYTYNSSLDSNFKDGIVVDKDNFVINGENHVIDASNQAKIFKITGNNVTLKNLNFINGYCDEYSENEIIIFENTGSVENCRFINNTATGNGTLYFENGDVINSTFINNKARRGGQYISKRMETYHVLISPIIQLQKVVQSSSMDI